MAREKRGLSEEELEVSYSGPALATNRFFVAIGVRGMRLAFAEQHSSDMKPKFRTAIIMSIPHALELRDLLNNMLKNVTVESVDAGQTIQ